jgi:Sulfotransferase domain
MSTADARPIRVAVWSGPRNISTALMRSWENRVDTVVVDEPFYAHYLVRTGVEHPGRDEVIADQENDWKIVAGRLTKGDCDGAQIEYQKHMAHHLLPGMTGDWLIDLRNVLLVRDPTAMLLSLSRVLPEPAVSDTGLRQQIELARWLTEALGTAPQLVDSRAILEHPADGLASLCAAVGVDMDERMLSWPAGSRESDGIWAKHWYESVETSTGFEPYRPPTGSLADPLRDVLSECLDLHAELLSLCRPII